MIPAWPKVKLKSTYHGLYDGPHATPKESDDGAIFLGIKNVTEDGRLDLSEIRHIAEDDLAKWTKRVTPTKDDIVFSYEATLHRYARIPEGFRGCLGRRMALIRPDLAKVDTNYLFNYFLSPLWRAEVEKHILSGATVDRIPLTNVPEFELYLPPLKVQHKISTILSSYDALIENNLKRIKLLEEMAQITYAEWFVRMKFPGHETSVFDEETVLPVGWRKRKLEDIAEFSNGYAFYTKGYSETGFDVIDLGNISKSSDLAITGQEKKVSQELYKASSKFHLCKNDVVIAMTDITKELGILAKSAIIDKDNTYVLNQRVGRLRSKVDYIDYSFIYALINDKRFIGTMHSMSKGAVQFYFNTKDIINYEVVIPAQSTIEAFQKQYKPFLEARQTLKEQISFLKEARDILLPRLMTGMIDIEQVELPEDMLKLL
jgi:type I restriction enzyme S subunit